MSNSEVKGGIKYAPIATSEADMDLLSDKIVEYTQTGLVVLSEKGRIVLLNPQAKKMLGLTDEALGNLYMEYLFDDERNDPFNEAILKTVYYKKESLNSILSFFKEDEERQYSVTTSYFSNKEHRYVLISMMDVSPLFRLRDTKKALDKIKKMNVELESAWQEADLANRAKTTFLSNMTHEIRTPLAAILGMNDLIMREYHDDKLMKYASGINSSGKMLLYLVNDILDISKIQSGRMELIPVDYSLQEMMQEMYEMISFRAEEKELEFSVNIAKNCPRRLVGDEIRIKQIIANLMTNAVKYTSSGSVKVNVECVGEDNASNVLLKIEVADTGIGIKDEDRDEIFKRFTRVDPEKNREVEGTGLGLNIVVSLLDLMGGRLEFESVYEKGSVFTAVIPQKISDRTAIVKGAYSESGEKRGTLFLAPDASLLVVDDNASNLQLVRSFLKRTELRIETATGGAQALRMMQEDEFDVVLMDLVMPDLDGAETLKRLRQLKPSYCKTVPVIAFTADDIHEKESYYKDAGFCDYIMKPVESKRLEEKVMAYLPISKLSYTKGLNAANTSLRSYLTESEADYYISKYYINVNVAIRLLNGSVDLYEKLINVFCEQIRDRKNFLREFAASGDMRKYSIIAHAIKGDAKALGAESLAMISEVHEEQARNGDTEYVCRRLDSYFEEIDLVQEGLAKLRIRFAELRAGREEETSEESREEKSKSAEKENTASRGVAGDGSDENGNSEVPDEKEEICRQTVEAAQNLLDDFDDNTAIEKLEELIQEDISPKQKKEINRALFALRHEFDGDKAAEILANVFTEK